VAVPYVDVPAEFVAVTLTETTAPWGGFIEKVVSVVFDNPTVHDPPLILYSNVYVSAVGTLAQSNVAVVGLEKAVVTDGATGAVVGGTTTAIVEALISSLVARIEPL